MRDFELEKEIKKNGVRLIAQQVLDEMPNLWSWPLYLHQTQRQSVGVFDQFQFEESESTSTYNVN